MPGAAAVALALALLTTSVTTAHSQGATPPGFKLVARAELYTGVEYLKLDKAKVPVVAHVAHIAPGAPVDLRVVNAYDKVSTSTRELETTSSMCGRTRCVVGVNGDFHKLGTPAGGVVVDGRMLHSPDPGRPQLTRTADGHLVAGPLPWSGSFTVDGVEIAVTTVNAEPPAGGLALFTPAYGSSTESASRTELVVGAPAGVGALNQPITVELRSVRSGAGPIPADGAVLSGDGVAGQQLRDLWAKRRPGVKTPARLLISSPVKPVLSIGAEPVVLRDGKRALPWRDPNVINPRQPHTLVAWNKAGDTYLIAVDGRQPGSEGVTMAEAADFLLALGATDAVNLDGGGGTTFVAGGSVWNRPSDNDPARPAQYEERGGTNSLVVMSRPGAPLPPAAPPAPKPLPTAPSPGTAPNGEGPGTGWEAGPNGPSDGADGALGPVTGVGGQVAAGDLPLGSASAARRAPGSAPPGGDPAAPSPVAPEGAQGAPAAGGGDGSGGGTQRAKGGPALVASTVTRHVVDAAVGRRWTLPRFGLVAAAALATGGLRVRIKRRRRLRSAS